MSAIVGAGQLGQSGIRNLGKRKQSNSRYCGRKQIQMHPTEPIKHAVRKGRIYHIHKISGNKNVIKGRKSSN
jgi:hypothetical protein